MIDTNLTFQDTCVGQLSLFDGIVYLMFKNKAKNEHYTKTMIVELEVKNKKLKMLATSYLPKTHRANHQP